MPPWTPRPVVINSPNSASSSRAGRHHSPSRMTSDELLNQAYGIPTLHPSQPDPPQSSRPRRNQNGFSHGRSMSHPFPSLFSGKTKRQTEFAGSGLDSTDVDVNSSTASSGPSKTQPVKVQNKDLMTGKCMTCDSMVRWPRELSFFRCTVCLTINDLTSDYEGLAQKRHRRHGSLSGNAHVETRSPQRGKMNCFCKIRSDANNTKYCPYHSKEQAHWLNIVSSHT